MCNHDWIECGDEKICLLCGQVVRADEPAPENVQGIDKFINQIIHGDCLEVLKEFPDHSIDLIVTDPPYKTTSRGGVGNTGGMLKSDVFKKGQVFKHNDITPEQFFPELYRVLKERTHCYVMTNHKNLQEFINVATNCGFHFTKCLIWDKGNKIMGHYYMSQFEYILFFRKGSAKRINNCGTPDILSVPNRKTKGENGKNLHDTEKPIELMRILVENSSEPSDVVLDPFVGIGTTAIACLNTDRKFIGIELDEQYVEIARRRINAVGE
jgi:site-specific DNA-methyltransferase (adenine-specific)